MTVAVSLPTAAMELVLAMGVSVLTFRKVQDTRRKVHSVAPAHPRLRTLHNRLPTPQLLLPWVLQVLGIRPLRPDSHPQVRILLQRLRPTRQRRQRLDSKWATLQHRPIIRLHLLIILQLRRTIPQLHRITLPPLLSANPPPHRTVPRRPSTVPHPRSTAPRVLSSEVAGNTPLPRRLRPDTVLQVLQWVPTLRHHRKWDRLRPQTLRILRHRRSGHLLRRSTPRRKSPPTLLMRLPLS